MKFPKAILAFILFTPIAVSQESKEWDQAAKDVFARTRPAIFQIRVLDKNSQKKVGAGSGFQVDDQGHIITNYHVISEVIMGQHPRVIQYQGIDGLTGEASILDVDLVNDLALLKGDHPAGVFLPLRKSDGLERGSRMYSLGNLHDRGVVIVDGIFNGLRDSSWDTQFLFSGSVNPGMSGGPALDINGEVVGVNVATSGQQVSYIVPVSFVTELLGKVSQPRRTDFAHWRLYMQDQLRVGIEERVSRILRANWEDVTLGEALIPGSMDAPLQQWIRAPKDEKKRYKSQVVSLYNLEYMHIHDSFRTGQILFRFRWVTTDDLNPFAFYSLLRRYFFPVELENADKRWVYPYEAYSGFVNLDGVPAKAVVSLRSYKSFPALNDFILSFITVGENDRALKGEVVVEGITRDMAMQLSEKVLRSISWKS